ncbi:MAG: hypothetical protein AAF548_00470 [Actinomycetota bacterium]
MTEDRVDRIDDEYGDSDLSDRWKTTVGWADVVIGADGARDATAAATEEFSAAELAELTLTIAVAQGFSKAAIAWGPAPDLPTMTIPTPGS